MSILREIEAVRHHVGIWTRDDFTILQFQGKDALSWLNSQTSNNLLTLKSGQGCRNCMLDRTGRVLAMFTAHRWEDECWLVIQKQLVPVLQQRLETHLFLEDVTMTDVGADTPQILLEGPRTPLLLHAIALDAGGGEASFAIPAEFLSVAPFVFGAHELLLFRVTDSGEDGFLVIPAPGEAGKVYAELLDRGAEFFIEEVSPAAQEVLRFEGASLRYGREVDATCIVSETPLERDAVSYDKGCYLGQEVVARLKAYGSLKQALVGLTIADTNVVLPDPPQTVFVDGKKAGRIVSQVYSPTSAQWLAMAYLDRDHRVPGTRYEFTAGDAEFEVEVVHLPFHKARSREDYARVLYENALELFRKDVHDEDDTAIRLLEECIVLAPAFEDAYESLGVILHRHHRVEEAIHYMKILAAINPSCVMAHSNLSVFYQSKGLIPEAEAEKAIAEQLFFKKKLNAEESELRAKQERARLKREAAEKIGMFREVLEIDPHDSIALMGLGSAYIQLEQYAEAIPPLQAALGVKRDYSAAFLKLGKCHEILGQWAEAMAVYEEGIAVAARKGDLMPMREMERNLKALQGRTAGA